MRASRKPTEHESTRPGPENMGQIQLTVDTATRQVTAYKAGKVKRSKDPSAGLVAA